MLWLNYFKRLDVQEHEKIIDIIIALSLGFFTPTIALWIYYVLELIGINFNGKLINDFIYSILGVGLTEEFSKLLGVFVAFKLLKNRINEPIDYLIFGGIVALGFSIRENYIYYNNHGSLYVTGRSFISSLVHIINTSICVYGIYRFKIFKKGNLYLNSIVGITAAVLSHGLFDFFLIHEVIGILSPFLSSIIYLIGINFWIQMINNCLNYSPFFNYQKLYSTSNLYKTILAWYVAIMFLEFFYSYYYNDLHFAIKNTLLNTINEGILLIIVALRSSRLKISKRKYFQIKLQFPIYFTKNKDEDIKILGLPFKIRGENTHEFRFIEYMGDEILICPTSKNKSIFSNNRRARLLKKYFIKNDVVIYLVEIFSDDKTSNQIFLLKPKTNGVTLINQIYPLALLIKYEDPSKFHEYYERLSFNELKSIEYIYLKHTNI